MADAFGFHNQNLISTGTESRNASQSVTGPVTLIAIGAFEVECTICPNVKGKLSKTRAIDTISKASIIYDPASGIKLLRSGGGKIPILRKQHSCVRQERR